MLKLAAKNTNSVLGAQEHLLEKPKTCVIQLASRDQIPLLGTPWPALIWTHYATTLHLCWKMAALIIIFPLCACVSVVWRFMSAARHILYSTWSKMTAPLAVTVRYYITQIWRLGLLCRSADSDPVHVCMCVSLPTVLVLTLLVFREASGCHRSLGAQRRAGKTHVKIYSHWVWLQASHWAAIWQMTFNRSSYSFCILMSEEKSEGGMGRL